MADAYRKPLQPRAIVTEQRFLDALDALLKRRSLAQLTVDEIAEHAGLTRGAFLKRFGSKKQALLLLFQRYCDACSVAIEEVKARLPTATDSLDQVCTKISQKLEEMQRQHFSANRAINEQFMEDLLVAEPTKAAFRETVGLMRCVQQTFLRDAGATEAGAYAAAQLLLTINYNYVIRAMPALPPDPAVRHRLIGSLMVTALRI